MQLLMSDNVLHFNNLNASLVEGIQQCDEQLDRILSVT